MRAQPKNRLTSASLSLMVGKLPWNFGANLKVFGSRLHAARGYVRRDKLRTYLKRARSGRLSVANTFIPEIAQSDIELIARFQQFTMTNFERQWALISAIRYLNAANIQGDIVECGVWRGGNMLLAKELCDNSPVERRFFLYDTFSGMSQPTESDASQIEKPACETYNESLRDGYCEWAYASEEEVKQNFRSANLLDDSVLFIKGRVEETLVTEDCLPEKIALLRLDTDWYESTKVELEILYPRLVSGGILIIDDYGHWAGARKAVDEYFESHPVLLNRVDYSARLVVRP